MSSQLLPTEIWQAEVWECGLDDDAVTIVRWSMVCKEFRETYMKHCGLLHMLALTPVPFGDAHVDHLPPGLLFLSLGFSNNLTDACIPRLPRGLVVLRVKDSLLGLHLEDGNRLTDACIASLPPGLRRLILPDNTQLTEW